MASENHSEWINNVLLDQGTKELKKHLDKSYQTVVQRFQEMRNAGIDEGEAYIILVSEQPEEPEVIRELVEYWLDKYIMEAGNAGNQNQSNQ